MLPGLQPYLATTDADYDVTEELGVLRKDGTLIRDKARMLVEEVFLPQAFYAMTDPDASHQTRLDYAKQIIEIADVKPKQNQAQAGGGFTVNIMIPDQGKPMLSVTPVATLDGVAIEPRTPEPVEPVKAPPAVAPPFRVPDFQGVRMPGALLALNDDLRGPAVPTAPT